MGNSSVLTVEKIHSLVKEFHLPLHPPVDIAQLMKCKLWPKFVYIRHALNSLDNYLKDDYVDRFSIWGGIIIDFPLPLIVFIVINEISKRIQETCSIESVTK